jgi:RNA polymerase sigma-70 factor (ECF subfamily)
VHDVTVTDEDRGTAAFEQFFLGEHTKLVAIALGWTGDRDTAREVAQEALVRAHRDWEKVRTLDRPGAWVRRVLINLLIDQRRRVQRERGLVERLGPPAAVDAPSADDRRWWAAVRALPDRQRAVVTLHYLEDLPIADVAAILDIAPGTVKSTLSHARDNLRAALSSEDPR